MYKLDFIISILISLIAIFAFWFVISDDEPVCEQHSAIEIPRCK